MSARSLKTNDQPDHTIPEALLYLNILREAHGRELKITLEEKGSEEEGILQRYFQTNICQETILSLSQEIYALLNRSTHSTGNSNKGIGQSLQQVGQHLYDSLFPFPVKERLAAICSQNLYLTIDDSLVGVPWEIMHDGEDFFCLRYNMGRRVHTSHSAFDPAIRRNDQKMRMWILADPRNDLPDSYNEGNTLARKLEQWGDNFEVFLETTNIDLKKIHRRIYEFDIIHYAGHAVYDQKNPNLSGWHLKDGYLTAQHIMQMSGGKKTFPFMIFSNACQSGRTSEWPQMGPDEWINSRSFDLVNAFLRCGVRHYIGTFQDISDPISIQLALYFYNLMMQSRSVGESLRHARLQLIDQYGHDTLIWANYMLYGNPAICYSKYLEKEKRQKDFNQPETRQQDSIRFEQKRQMYRSDDQKKEKGATDQGEGIRTGSIFEGKKDRIDRGPRIPTRNRGIRRLFFCLGSGLLLLFILLAIGFFISPKDPSSPSPDLSWEKEKWQIVRKIQEKLELRYSVSEDSGSYNQTLPGRKSRENVPFSLCIVPAIPRGKGQEIDQQMTERLIEELNLFWIDQSGFVLVERDRLEFVLEELERATSSISESKIQFALGKVLGAKGILFVRIFPQSGRFPLSYFNREANAFIRCVNTETSAVEAYAKASFKVKRNLGEISRNLGEKILQSLAKRHDS